nr:hypothetical protein B0A51_10997 [Rachicladosporium sp. CCFEE 5018]
MRIVKDSHLGRRSAEVEMIITIMKGLPELGHNLVFPRFMPSKGKAKSAPNQHDKRHESGLAAPGKRVTKQRSNGHLNGAPNGKPAQSAPTPPLPSPGLGSTAESSRQVKGAVTSAGVGSHVTGACAEDVESAQRDRTGSDASGDEGMSYTEPAAHNKFDLAPHVEVTTAAMTSKSAPAAGPAGVVSTILTYYPLRDAISILILLLSLPPTLVLVIQSLFASLTFVPPTAGISFSTLPNVKEMFNASGLGYPALATILLVDLLFYLCWLPFQKPLQNMFLDLSQTVIAISLSGAAASNGTPTSSIVTCSAIVCIVHMLRYRSIDLGALDYLRSVIHKSDIGVELSLPSAFSSLFSRPEIEHTWFYTAVRTILGVHIVSQGVTTCIRRSLASANERTSNSNSTAKTDPEAAAGVDATPRTNSDSAQHPLPALNTDGRLPGPSASSRDAKGKDSSSKKKRKQANQVRSQQPLWAAIASTKVTFLKELEQKDAAEDAKDAARIQYDTHTNTTFTNTQSTNTDKIWINDVRDTEISFQLELASDLEQAGFDDVEEGLEGNAGADKTRPFFVKINSATWTSIRITPCATQGERDQGWWDGKIVGLAPLSTYHCEIVATAGQRVLSSINLITQSAPTAEQAATVPSQSIPQALRPSSPVTTLKQSLVQAEARLSEARNRAKKSKRDQKAANADVKREIATLKGKLEGFTGNDDKQTRRIQQLTQAKETAETAITDLRQQLNLLGDLPADEAADMERKRRDWQVAANIRNAKSKELAAAKSESERELSHLKSELSASDAKHEKLLSRRQQKEAEIHHVEQKRKTEVQAKELHDQHRAQEMQRRQQQDHETRTMINSMIGEHAVLSNKTMLYRQEAHAIQTADSAQSGYAGHSSPPTPESAALHNGHLAQASGYTNFFPGGYAGPTQSYQPQYQPAAPRGRSSSMLSQASGFTDNNEEQPFEPRHHQTWSGQSHTLAGAPDTRKQSEGSGGSGAGSGSGSGTNGSTASNSPRPDATAKPFSPAAAMFSPVAQPSKMAVLSHGKDFGAVGDGR